MANFPKLKTGAVGQYPLTRELSAQHQTLRFMDGAQQRYRDSAGSRRRWVIRLDLLDEGELAAVEEFFIASQGAFGTFTFVDPWDEQEYENCRMERDELTLQAIADMQGSTTLRVIQ